MALLTKIFGKSGAQLEVDPTFMAARIAMRPLDYKKNGRVLMKKAQVFKKKARFWVVF